MLKEHRIYFERNWGFFIGSISDNFLHKHYALQISISIEKEIIITNQDGKSQDFKICFIKSNKAHQFVCESPHLTILLDPASTLGLYFTHLSSSPDVSDFTNKWTIQLKKIAIDFIVGDLSFLDLVPKIRGLFEEIRSVCAAGNPFSDDRIKIAVAYLEEHLDDVISAEKIAAICCLSPSRFLHLFKEKTGISYRRMQLWNKISRSFDVLPTQSITKTAHQYGFTDSAHYTKVFKETFGVTPKHLLQR